MNPSHATPMIKQYLSIKGRYPDAILLYRMGDFYEMFFEDAETASRILEITLTSRNKKDEFPVPMCGVPHRAVKGYIAKLINNGFKVAICDQKEDPAEAKGLVDRDVVRVITPGMIIEDDLLDEKSNNYIIAIARYLNRAGLSCLDISTGLFRLTETAGSSELSEEILRIAPSEILLPESSKNDSFFSGIADALKGKIITYLDDVTFEHKKCRERLTGLFKTLSLEGFGCEDMKAGVCAAGALVYYLSETQKQSSEHFLSIETYSLGKYLLIDETSSRNLEIMKNLRTGSKHGTLLTVLDRTVTPMGGRLLRRWLGYPLLDSNEIIPRLDAVEEAKSDIQARRNIRESLKLVHDMERLGSKIVMGHSSARDLVALKNSLFALPLIRAGIMHFKAGFFEWNPDIEALTSLADLIDRSVREDAPPVISEGGLIKSGYNAELDNLIRAGKDGKSLLAELEAREKEETKINSLKIRYNKVFGYYIEVPKSQAKLVPPRFIRKQTLVNAERYITDELKQYETNVLSSGERRNAIEYELFCGIREEAAKHNPAIQQAAGFIAGIDCITGFAEVAHEHNYTRPGLNSEGLILIEDGRHPVVERMIAGERFVPNSIRMDDQENQVLIITGPNMAGKSTVLRQVALIVLMAHIGSFVPAAKASVNMTDRIYTRVGALDNLSAGQSTFMVEMQETANILNNSGAGSLVIMDEIGRGTSTFDGLSIAWAVAEYLHDLNGKGVKTLFATHYHELIELASSKPRVKNFNILVKEWNDEIIFLRKLAEGGTNRSYGIQVARLAGIPEKIIARAKKILYKIESEHGINGMPLFAENDAGSKKMHSQISMFPRPENFIVERLKNIDISKMTPLDALNCLNELQEKARKAGDD
ncbi:MAG: DNA mismatch repair protein MutS [Desulfobacteraceae bacterium]|nr:MAG: DNA mismatch repair protein MutS [Desulfobacteraceae bacterium]